jgi:hypothetical protein
MFMATPAVGIVIRVVLAAPGGRLAPTLQEGRLLVESGRHPDVPAQRKRGEHVLRLPPASPPERRPESDGETGRVDPDRLRGQEVAEFVDEDDEPENQNGREER